MDIVFAVRPDFSCLHPNDIRTAVVALVGASGAFVNNMKG